MAIGASVSTCAAWCAWPPTRRHAAADRRQGLDMLRPVPWPEARHQGAAGRCRGLDMLRLVRVAGSSPPGCRRSAPGPRHAPPGAPGHQVAATVPAIGAGAGASTCAAWYTWPPARRHGAVGWSGARVLGAGRLMRRADSRVLPGQAHIRARSAPSSSSATVRKLGYRSRRHLDIFKGGGGFTEGPAMAGNRVGAWLARPRNSRMFFLSPGRVRDANSNLHYRNGNRLSD